MKTKVLLINSLTTGVDFYNTDHLYQLPLGLLYLGSVLEKNDIEVKVLDYSNLYCTSVIKDGPKEESLEEYFEKELPQRLAGFTPDIIGIGCIFSGAFQALKIIAQQIKKLFPNSPIVIGGIHATIFASKILETCSYIDYIIIGEGEESFLELVRALLNNDSASLQAIDGIAYRYAGAIVNKPKTKFITDLDSLPMVNVELLDLKNYHFDSSRWYSPKGIKVGFPFSILSSRSCPCRCSFCSMWFVHGPKIRFRSAQNTVDEIQYLYDNYNGTYFSFFDDNLAYDRQRILDICNEIIKRGLNIQFDTPNGVAIKSLDQEVIDAMVSAGLVKINLSPESGSSYIRNNVIGKWLKTEKIYEVFESCAKHNNLYIGAYFIIGMPEETEETLQETYEMIVRLPLDRVSLTYATPYPGTKLYNYCVKHNLLEYDHESDFDYKREYMFTTEPYFEPHKVKKEDLIAFSAKCKEVIKERRKGLAHPENYPIRYSPQN